MTEPANVRLLLSNRSENVLLVREMLTGVGENVTLESSDLYDIRTAVTEACNNVVLHAYEGAEGPLEVELRATADAIEVVVRDRGIGIRPRIRTPDTRTLGIGVPLIQALVNSVEFSDAGGEGTEVRMEFLTPSQRPLPAIELEGHPDAGVARHDLATTTSLTVAPASLARTVLPRVLSVLAARAHFSTDRISDTQMLADALAAHVPGSLGADRLSLTIGVEPRTIELRVGPLGEANVDELMVESAVEGLGGVIEKLTDDRRVATVGAEHVLALQLTDHR